MTLSFAVPDEFHQALLRLVASSSGLGEAQLSITVGGVTDVEFTVDGTQAFGAHTACRFIAGLSPAASQLLGDSPEQQAKVAEWLAFHHTHLTPLMDDQLLVLNAALASTTYLAGGGSAAQHPSLADLVLYAVVAPAASAFPIAQHSHFCNLLRWYDHLHSTVDAAALFPAAVAFVRPRYVAPPAPAPPAPKAAAAAAGAAADKPAAAAAAAPSASSSKANGKAAAAAAAADGESADGAKPKKAEKKSDKARKAAAAASAAGAAAGAGAAPATPAASGEGPATAAAAAAASAAPSAASPADDGTTVDLLDIRVGQIVSVGRHPNADTLYVEQIDLGEASGPRQVVSGLAKFVSEADMAGRRVCVVCNLKPAKMREVVSYGMVLCASDEAHAAVVPVAPPAGAALGERVTFEGYSKAPEAQLNPKRKQFEKIAPDLRVDAGGVCVYRGVPFMTSQGPVTAPMPGGWVK